MNVTIKKIWIYTHNTNERCFADDIVRNVIRLCSIMKNGVQRVGRSTG